MAGTTDQATPSHDSINAPGEPLTAVQKDAPTHEMPASSPWADGVGTTDQTDPFHDSANVLFEALETSLKIEPTAMHDDTRLQATARSAPGLGEGITDQTDPFHDSISVDSVGSLPVAPWTEEPTAVHDDDETQAMPDRALYALTVGDANTDQTEPVRLSIKGWLPAVVS